MDVQSFSWQNSAACRTDGAACRHSWRRRETKRHDAHRVVGPKVAWTSLVTLKLLGFSRLIKMVPKLILFSPSNECLHRNHWFWPWCFVMFCASGYMWYSSPRFIERLKRCQDDRHLLFSDCSVGFLPRLKAWRAGTVNISQLQKLKISGPGVQAGHWLTDLGSLKKTAPSLSTVRAVGVGKCPFLGIWKYFEHLKSLLERLLHYINLYHISLIFPNSWWCSIKNN